MTSQQITDQMFVAMSDAGAPGPLIYAFLTTGLMLTPEGYHRASPADRADWDRAIEDFGRNQPDLELAAARVRQAQNRYHDN
jgi:hypothetical protein